MFAAIARRVAVLLVVVAGLTVGSLPMTTATASAVAGCPINVACVYSGPNQTGAVAELPGGFGCRSAAALGLPAVRSAVNNPVEQAIILFADANCQTATNPSFVLREVDDISPPALSVRIRPLP